MAVAIEPPTPAAATPVQVLQSIEGTNSSAPAKLGKGEVHSAVFVISAESACASAHVGSLAVTWKRPRCVLCDMWFRLACHAFHGVVLLAEPDL